jgi:hypothetical protein
VGHLNAGEEMIESILKMPISQQLHLALLTAIVGGGIGIAMRELSRDRAIKIWGRLLGLGAFFVVSCFAIHAAHECEVLSVSNRLGIVGRGVSLLADGEPTARQSPSSFPAVIGSDDSESESDSTSLKTYQFTSKEGHTLKWSYPDASASATTRPPTIEFHALRRGK